MLGLWWAVAAAAELVCSPGSLEDWRRQSLACPECMEAGLDALLREESGCTEARLARAALHHGRGEIERAVHVLEGADRDDPRVVVALALALHLVGRDDLGLLDRALALRPADPVLLRVRARRAATLVERIRLLQEAVERVPRDEDLTLDLLDALERAGRPRAALEAGRAALERHPSPRVAARVAELAAVVPVELDDAFVHVAEDGVEEVVVYSVEAARRRLEARLRELGYGVGRRRGARTRYEAERAMLPWVELGEDGTVVVQRSGVVRRPEPLPGILPLGDVGIGTAAPWVPPGVPLEERPAQPPSAQITLTDWMSERKLSERRDRVLRAIQPAAWAWRRAIAERTFSDSIGQTLPPRLRRLWDEGTPLGGGEPLLEPAERRAALLQFWRSRTCSPAGNEARALVEAFLTEVVQRSAHPFTSAELDGVEACGVRLQL